MFNITLNLYEGLPEELKLLVYEHGIPALEFDHLAAVGRRVVCIFNLQEKALVISVHEMLAHIANWLATPFGANYLLELGYKPTSKASAPRIYTNNVFTFPLQ